MEGGIKFGSYAAPARPVLRTEFGLNHCADNLRRERQVRGIVDRQPLLLGLRRLGRVRPRGDGIHQLVPADTLDSRLSPD